MHKCARALEEGNITRIPFVLVNYAGFYESGSPVVVAPTTATQYVAYVDGAEHERTGKTT
ncbi:hypothetical protein BGZ70_010222, partial [Mortierella alpina]